MDDGAAIHKVNDILGARLFKPKKGAPSTSIQTINESETCEQVQEALGSLGEHLATAVLQSAIANGAATIDALISLVPGPLDAAVSRAAFPWAFNSINLEVDCFKHATATSSACLGNMARFPNTQHLTIKLAAHRYFNSEASMEHMQHLRSALEHATRNSVAVDLHVHTSCPASLKHLLAYTCPDSAAVKNLVLADTPAAITRGRSPSRAFWDIVRNDFYQGLQSLSIYHSPSSADKYRDLIFFHQQRMTAHLACFTALTQLHIHESMPASQPAVFLRALTQLRDLDACFTVQTERELHALQSAVSGLSQLTRLALSDTRSCNVHTLVYRNQIVEQSIPAPDAYIPMYIEAVRQLEKDEDESMRWESLGFFRLMNMQLPSSAPLQHLDLSRCFMSDHLLVALAAQLQVMAASRGPTLQHLELSVLQPGIAAMALLKTLQIFSQLTTLCILSEIPYTGAEELEGLICNLTSLRDLKSSNLCTREAMHDRPPLLTALTGLTELIVWDSAAFSQVSMPIAAAVSDASFFEALTHLTRLHTLHLTALPLSNVQAMQAFASSLQSLQSLCGLLLCYVPPVHREAVQLFSTGLAALHNLTQLQLHQRPSHEGRDAPVLQELCGALHHMSSLKELSVTGMSLSTTCCSSFGHALACSALSRLQSLEVKGCDITNGGYDALAHALGSLVEGVEAESDTLSSSTSRGHLALKHFGWSYNTLEDEDCIHLACIISLYPNVESCKLRGMDLPSLRDYYTIEGAVLCLKKLQHLDVKKNGDWSVTDLSLLCDLAAHSPPLRAIDVGKMSKVNYCHELSTGSKLMSREYTDLQPWNDPMRCLNLQEIAAAYNEFWWTSTIRVTLAGVGLLVLGGCVSRYMTSPQRCKS